MANSRQDLVEQLQLRYLECVICSELYDEQTRIPKLLPCLHTLCMACLVGLNSGNKIKCPFCNKSHHIKREDLAKLPKDNTRRDLTCFLQNNTEVNCEICNKTALNIRICNTCDINMCVDCQRQHKTIFEEHCFGCYSPPGPSNSYSCKLTGHDNGHLRYVCKETKCNILICPTCAITEHKGHNIEDIERVITNEKEFFSYLIERLKDRIARAESFKDTLFPGYNKFTIKFFQEDIRHINNCILNRVSSELEELSKLKDEQVQYILNTENILQSFVWHARDCCEFSEQILQSSNQKTFYVLEQAMKEKICDHLNMNMDEIIPTYLHQSKEFAEKANQFNDILYLVSLHKSYRRGLRKISSFPLFHSAIEIIDFIEQTTQYLSIVHIVTFLALLFTVLTTTVNVFADEIPQLWLGSDIVPDLHFIFNNSPYLFPCRSFDNKTVSSNPYSSGFICSGRRHKFKGIFGNASFKNDQEYELEISVKIEGIKQGIHDKMVIFEIGLSRNKVHDSYSYENTENSWVVYGINCGTDICLQYNDRISPYIQRIKHDKVSGLLETRLVLRLEPKTKSLQVSSNSSTITYTFTNVSATEAELWPIFGIYRNDSFISASIISSYPSIVTFDASTIFPGLFVSKDAKVFANWNKSVSGYHFHNPISSYIFSEPMISKSQEKMFYTVEITIKEHRFLPNNTMLFEVGTLGKHHFGSDFFINILMRYDFEQNNIGYFTEHMNETSKLCDRKSISLPFFTITAISLFYWGLGNIKGALYNGKRRIDGKTVIITGGNTGIGKETAIDLAKRGAKVIIACRDMTRANAAADDIKCISGSKEIYVRQLDLASLKSVRSFAENIKKTEKRIDILLNNAGVMACPYGKTEDGFEMQFGVNHLGHFLLTNLLLDLIKKSAPSRIINVSSFAHVFTGPLDFDDIAKREKSYSESRAYSQSKLCNILFTKQLASLLTGTGVTTYALHPGSINTELARHMRVKVKFIMEALYFIITFFIKTPYEGAQTNIYCAVEESLDNETGKYYSDCAETTPTKAALDDGAAKKLWELSEKLVQL